MEEDSKKNVRNRCSGTKSLELVHRDFDDRFSMGAHFFIYPSIAKNTIFV